jgi:hypothetical protein
LFEIDDVPVETTRWVREQIQQNRGGWIYGPIGSGKSHAVRAAEPKAIRVDVVPGPLLGQRFVADLARQLGPDGRRLLEAVKREGIAAALEIAEAPVNGHPLIVDTAEHLLLQPVDVDAPHRELWQADTSALRGWLEGRMEGSPTFLVSEWSPGPKPFRFQHRAPTQPPIRLRQPSADLPIWERLASRAQHNPGALILARALVVVCRAEAFALLAEAKEDDMDVATFLSRLGQAFRSSVPRSWQRALALLAALGEVPRDAVEPIVVGRAGIDAGAHEPPDPEQALAVLAKLRELELVKEQDGRLSVLPVLHRFGVRPLTEQERTELLPAVGHQLLARVNDVRSLEPELADRVLLAHSIFVASGDVSNAERTAALHVHGLVELARRSSLDERFADACRQYHGILRMLRSSELGTSDRAGLRLCSYVHHYYAWNGSRAGILDDAACLEAYEHAVEDWLDNALWHQRVIQTLVRLGRVVEVRRAVARGEVQVKDHPRKEELLRVRPARTALNVGTLLLSLELIDPIIDVSADEYPEVADGRDALLRRWEQGLPCLALVFSAEGGTVEGSVKLLQPTEVRVYRSSGWAAELPALWKEASGERPVEALEALARELGEEVRRLVSTITPDLSEPEIRRKGELLSYVDALNSDIGLRHEPDRWVIGRIEGQRLIPTMHRLPPVEIPPALMPETTEGMYIARVPVYRDGFPSGPAEALEPAGRGPSYRDLVDLLERMNGGAA